MAKKLIVGTRGSALAVAQTHLILDQLKSVVQDLSFEVKTITTSGDAGHVAEVGAFVKEVEIALKNREVDFAVHSLKDMPVALPAGVVIACIPKRGEHRDCLVSKNHIGLNNLPHGAKLGTGSLRRNYELKELRPDLEIVPIRGNILTRMNHNTNGLLDAVILAGAGLNRIKMEYRVTQLFSIDEMMPAVAQGALAIEVRDDDVETIDIVRKIHDYDTAQSAIAERAFLLGLGGGCRMPIGAYAEVKNNSLHLQGLIYSEDGSRVEKGSIEGTPETAEETGRKLAEELLRKLGNR